MTDAEKQDLLDAMKTATPGDVVTWAELKPFLESLIADQTLTDITGTSGQVIKHNGTTWAAGTDATADAGTGWDSNGTLTANRSVNMDGRSITFTDSSANTNIPVFIFDDDNATNTRVWQEFKPLVKGVNGKSWFVNQMATNTPPGTIWNEVRQEGWNLAPGGSLANPALGFAIGYSHESNYDPDGDNNNAYGEIHKFYVTSAGLQVRLESYTINPGAENIDYYHTVDAFTIKSAYRKLYGFEENLFSVTAAGVNKNISQFTLYAPGESLRISSSSGNNEWGIRLYGQVGYDNVFFFDDTFARVSIPKIRITQIQTFADDAAAGSGGLVANMVYKTSTGELRIKL